MLVDAGSLGGDAFDVGRHVVAPFLRQAWVGGLDVLVLSHAQADHMSGAPAILRSFAVGEVWSPAPLGPSPGGLWIEEYLRHRRIPHRIVSASSPPVVWGDVRMEIWYPPRPGWRTVAGREPESLVLAVGIRDQIALLTGDIHARGGEQAIAARGARATVLKVPHHGSRTSSSAAFLETVRPRVAMVSVGHRSRFGHPHPEVLERYAALGVRLHRTDRHGAITVDMRPEGIRVETRREE
jgi:competence protein ComEC